MMDSSIPMLSPDYYRRQAARVRQLAILATMSAVKDHLDDVASEYERLAERADALPAATEPEPQTARPRSGGRIVWRTWEAESGTA